MASDTTTFHYPHRTSTMTYRVPTPPRIVIPPPQLNSDAVPEIKLQAVKSTSFPATAERDRVIKTNAALEWTYERRREATQILPYLYLGPMGAARDEAFLRREGITCILGVRQKGGASESRLMNGALRKADELGLERHTVDVTSNQDLIRTFPETTRLISAHLSRSLAATGALGRMLVFCESGNERSAGVVAAYLMESHEDVDHVKAVQVCQAQRFCVNFDDGLKRLLQGYWDILCASRAVAAQQQQPQGRRGGREQQQQQQQDAGEQQDGAGRQTSGKRCLSRDEDGDDEMGGIDEDDLERFGGRVFAPFIDAPL